MPKSVYKLVGAKPFVKSGLLQLTLPAAVNPSKNFTLNIDLAKYFKYSKPQHSIIPMFAPNNAFSGLSILGLPLLWFYSWSMDFNAGTVSFVVQP